MHASIPLLSLKWCGDVFGMRSCDLAVFGLLLPLHQSFQVECVSLGLVWTELDEWRPHVIAGFGRVAFDLWWSLIQFQCYAASFAFISSDVFYIYAAFNPPLPWPGRSPPEPWPYLGLNWILPVQILAALSTFERCSTSSKCWVSAVQHSTNLPWTWPLFNLHTSSIWTHRKKELRFMGLGIGFCGVALLVVWFSVEVFRC